MSAAPPEHPASHAEVALVDLVDRLVDKGVVIAGDVTLAVADIDLVHVSLRLLVASAERVAGERGSPPPGPTSASSRQGGGLPTVSPRRSTRGPALAPDPAPDGQARGGPEGIDDLLGDLPSAGDPLPQRIDADPDDIERGLAQLVMTLIELLRQIMERQAIRRMEGGSLDDDEIERLGQAFMALEQRMEELKDTFGLSDEDLNIDLGPLGRLL